MQPSLFDEPLDLSQKIVRLGLSSGINSAALLCHLAQYPVERKPKRLLLYCAHFVNHSPDQLKFLTDCICYAIQHFDNVKIKVTWNDVLEYFRQEHIIPHPSRSPCSKDLKFKPSEQWAFVENDCDIDLIGYVKEELKRRTKRQAASTSINKLYPIGELSNEECFTIVDREIGWHPAIYDYRCGAHGLCKGCKKKQKRGFVVLGCKARIFIHGNCIPCKNGEEEDYENWNRFYPEYMRLAYDLSAELTELLGEPVTWGRDKAVNMCESCTFD